MNNIRERKIKTDSQQVDQRSTKQARIDYGYWHLLRMKAAKDSTTVKALLEEGAAWVLKDETAGK